jgi:hypothetical protein
VKTPTASRGAEHKPAKGDFYVDLLMQEWQMGEASRRIQTCVRQVLRELGPTAQLILRREPKLEVMIRPSARINVWAYFPMHGRLQSPELRIPNAGSATELLSAIRAAEDEVYRRRLIFQEYKPKPATRVLLLFGEKAFEKEVPETSYENLRDHLGHTLLYLRNPKARNECVDAEREWRRSLKEPAAAGMTPPERKARTKKTA